MNDNPEFETEIIGTGVPHVEPGTYIAVCEGAERVKTRNGEARKWYWRLPDADNFRLTQITSLATSGGSNGGKNIKVLRGRVLGEGEPLSTAEIVGKTAILVLTVDPESGYNRVLEVVSSPPGSGPAAAAPVPAVPPTPPVGSNGAEPPSGSVAHFEQRLARQAAEAQAATFTTQPSSATQSVAQQGDLPF
jgi:hypothetical protein